MVVGRTLSHYRVDERLGAGGMGEVYRARDLKLDRDVALKVLPENALADEGARSRFRKEAHALSRLSHPHIATLLDFDTDSGVDFLVMELVSGASLEEVVRSGPLPEKDVVRLGAQLARGLQAAHDQGVVHRDLKPSNLRLTSDGLLKILDFGLARLEQPRSTPPGHTTDTATAAGAVLGTPPYMSPEQLLGRLADARSDLYASGAVLYELATGQRTFGGRSGVELTDAILHHPPVPPRSVRPEISASLEAVILKALDKEPELRYQTARELLVDLERLQSSMASGGGTRGTTAAAGLRVRRERQWAPLALAFAAVALITAAATRIAWVLKPDSPRRLARFVVPLPATDRLGGLSEMPGVAISPDGSRLAYVASRGASQQIYLRPIDTLDSRPVAGTEGGSMPFFSPDGLWLGFTARGKLEKVGISGGEPVVLCDAPNSRGASWGDENTIVFAPFPDSGVWQVSADGTKPRVLTTPDKEHGEIGHRWPELLPGSKAVVFTVWKGGTDNDQIAVQSLDTGERRTVLESGTQARYSPTGHLIFGRAGSLMAVPFDPSKLETSGTPALVIDGIMRTGSGAAQFSSSTGGWLVYASGGFPERRLVSVDRKGKARLLGAPPQSYGAPRLSPDGRRVAVGFAAVSNDVWIYDLARNTMSRLTLEARNYHPVWTPDGSRVTFETIREGSSRLFWMSAGVSGVGEQLLIREHLHAPHSWSPDGKALLFDVSHSNTGQDIWVLRMDDERTARPFLQGPFDENAPVFSPDGRWVAYVSDESGRDEVYVQAYPGPGPKFQVSPDGGREPVWAHDGRELFYRDGDRMLSVATRTKAAFHAEMPNLLFDGKYVASRHAAIYDVMPDGQQFIMVTASDDEAKSRLVVVQEWAQGLNHHERAR